MSPRHSGGVRARSAHRRNPRSTRTIPVPVWALGLLAALALPLASAHTVVHAVVCAGVAAEPTVQLAAQVVLAQGQTSGQVQQLIDRATDWITGLLAALATLFLTIGAVRYIFANGNTSEIEHAKQAVKSAAVGYAFAALAPLIVQILSELVGQR